MSQAICKYLAREARSNGRLFSYCLEQTKSDRTWKPSARGEGRSMLEQAEECAGLNHLVAALLRGQTPQKREGALITDAAGAAEAVMTSANDLAEALEGMQDSELDRMLELPFGTYPASFAAGISNANMVYHWGQANYIELLDGDTEFRVPPEFVAK
jgi:hypothetical protein